MYDIMYDIISQTPNSPGVCISSLAAANLPPAQSSGALASDGDHDPDRVMDPDEARDYADQFSVRQGHGRRQSDSCNTFGTDSFL